MAGVWYCTREDVKNALDSDETARNNNQIDRAIEDASRSIERLLLRKFYPQTATRYFDWPDRNRSQSWRLYLGRDELISVTTLTVAGQTIPATDYFLEPANEGPPYTRLEIDLASSAAFTTGGTHQRAIAITGTFGYREDLEPVGELADTLEANSSDTATVSWTRNVGVGALLKIDNEYLVVTDRNMVDSTQNLGGNLDDSTNDVTVTVVDGTDFLIDQTILIGSERMLIVDITGNNLTVKRAWDGSVLATHTAGADVYTYSGTAVDRAQLGTTLAAHTGGADINRLIIPPAVRNLCIAEAMNTIEQEASGYARVVGAGESSKAAGGDGLEGLRSKVRKDLGRNRARVGAV